MPELSQALQKALMELIRQAYNNKGALLGKGAFGTVVRITLPTTEEDPELYLLLDSAGLAHLAGEMIAIKTVVRGKGNGEATRQEAATMCSLQRCPQVLKVYGVVSGEVRGEEGAAVMVDCMLLEYAVEGTLLTWGLKQAGAPGNELGGDGSLWFTMYPYSFLTHALEGGMEDCLALLSALIATLVYLWARGMTHSDLKLANFLVDGKGRIKCADWGTSSPMGTVPPGGTMTYLPPEGGNRAVQGERDMWAAGCIAASLVIEEVGRVSGLAMEIQQWGEEYFWPAMLFQNPDGSGGILEQQQDLEDLLKRMLACKGHKRISATEAMAHPYFAKLSGNDLEGFWQKVFAGEGPCLSVARK
jgi:serine/threonine protein kinase